MKKEPTSKDGGTKNCIIIKVYLSCLVHFEDFPHLQTHLVSSSSFCLSKSSFRPTVPYCAGFFCFLHFFPFQNFLALFSLSLFLYNRTNFQRFQTCFSSGKLVGKVLSMNAGRGMCMSRSRMLVWCVRCPSRVLSGPIHISGAGFIRPVTSRETRFRGQTHFLCMEHVLFPLSFLI